MLCIAKLVVDDVVSPFYRTYDILRQSSAACKALKVLKTTVLKRPRSTWADKAARLVQIPRSPIFVIRVRRRSSHCRSGSW
jgi:hypothetical protein